MIAWALHRLDELRERRKNQQHCERCRLFYEKTLEKCPHCSELKDYKVKLLLKQRVAERVGLGRGMLLLAACILVLLFFI